MGRIVTTSVRIDEEVWKRSKIKAIEKGVTVTDFLNEALQSKL